MSSIIPFVEQQLLLTQSVSLPKYFNKAWFLRHIFSVQYCSRVVQFFFCSPLSSAYSNYSNRLLCCAGDSKLFLAQSYNLCDWIISFIAVLIENIHLRHLILAYLYMSDRTKNFKYSLRVLDFLFYSFYYCSIPCTCYCSLKSSFLVWKNSYLKMYSACWGYGTRYVKTSTQTSEPWKWF